MPVDLSSAQPKIDEAQRAGETVSNLTRASGGLEQSLRDAVSGRYANSPLFKQREEATQNYITSAPRAREDLANLVQGGTILSPNQQQSILASRQAADVVPLTSLNDLLQAQSGGMENAIRGGLGAFNSILNAATQNYGILQGQADSAVNNLFRQADLEEQQRQFNETARLREMEIANSNKGTGGGGILDSILSNLLGGLGLGGQQAPAQEDYGPGPQYQPQSNGEMVVDDQTGIVWQFQDNQWIPIGRQ